MSMYAECFLAGMVPTAIAAGFLWVVGALSKTLFPEAWDVGRNSECPALLAGIVVAMAGAFSGVILFGITMLGCHLLGR